MLIYLASPYTDPDPAVRQRRYEHVLNIAGRLIISGKHVISPIVHCHPIALAQELPTEFGFWAEYDRKLIRGCDEFWVALMEGWRQSKGVTYEVRIAREYRIPIRGLDPISFHVDHLDATGATL